MLMFYALVAVCFLNGALAQIPGLGPCPTIETMPDFDIRRVPGRWFEAERYVSIGEMNSKCVTTDSQENGEGILQLNRTAVSLKTGKIMSSNGTKLRVADPAKPGKLELKSSSSNFWQNYWILGSDYDNYIVSYNCIDMKLMNLKYLWVWTRQRQPSKTIIDTAAKVIEKHSLNAKLLLTVDQANCDAVVS